MHNVQPKNYILKQNFVPIKTLIVILVVSYFVKWNIPYITSGEKYKYFAFCIKSLSLWLQLNIRNIDDGL